MSAVSANNARTRGSNAVNDVDAGFRRYFGGASEATAAVTVFLAMPNLRAIAAFGTPSAASLLISAQSSMVITLQSLKSAHFPSAVTAQFSSAVDTAADGQDSGGGAQNAAAAIAVSDRSLLVRSCFALSRRSSVWY